MNQGAAPGTKMAMRTEYMQHLRGVLTAHYLDPNLALVFYESICVRTKDGTKLEPIDEYFDQYRALSTIHTRKLKERSKEQSKLELAALEEGIRGRAVSPANTEINRAARLKQFITSKEPTQSIDMDSAHLEIMAKVQSLQGPRKLKRLSDEISAVNDDMLKLSQKLAKEQSHCNAGPVAETAAAPEASIHPRPGDDIGRKPPAKRARPDKDGSPKKSRAMEIDQITTPDRPPQQTLPVTPEKLSANLTAQDIAICIENEGGDPSTAPFHYDQMVKAVRNARRPELALVDWYKNFLASVASSRKKKNTNM